MWLPLTASAQVAYAALTLALAALWAPRVSPSPRAGTWWIMPFGVAAAAAMADGMLDVRGLLALTVLGGACRVARHAARPGVQWLAYAIVLATTAGLMVHAVPGFANPRVLDAVVLSPDSAPYTKYLNFDKGVAALFLLGLYVPARVRADRGLRRGNALGWRFAAAAAAVMALSLAAGYVRWDPKLPAWWPLWTWSMVALTALPEETVFRGILQTWLASRFRMSPRADLSAALVAGLAFGLAHAAGGVMYVALATVAGIGYGWIYATSRSLGAAIVAHAGLNAIHFVLFSYPALAQRSDGLIPFWT